MLDREGRLLLCEHGDRRVSRLEPEGGKRILGEDGNTLFITADSLLCRVRLAP